MSQETLGSQESPVDADMTQQQVSYLDSLEYIPPLHRKCFFVTLTYPGGLSTDHMARLQMYLQRGEPDGPGFYIGCIEGGDDTHKHVHVLLWLPESRRTDSVSRSLRSIIYSDDDLSSLERFNNLVLTRQVTDIAGALRYIFKNDTIQHLGLYRLPPGLDFERILEDCRAYRSARVQREFSDSSSFPSGENTRTIPPSKVPDFLVKASKELGYDLATYNQFGVVVHECLRRGIRFDMSKLRAYRVAVECIVIPTDSTRSKVIQHEIEWRASN